MNTLVRGLPRTIHEIILSASPFGSINELIKNKYIITCGVLLMLIFVSALAVIYNQNYNRVLFNQLARMQQKRDALYVEWGQLLLEESTWSTQSRIQQIATQKLDMIMPKQKNIVIVRQ